jgi:hypothetical protein
MNGFKVRDRIVELIRVPASSLKPHPNNWRIHPEAQLEALEGIIQEVGFTGAALAYKDRDGILTLLDGHARQEIAGDQEIPVLLLDVTELEANIILATFDPISGMARTNEATLSRLLASIETENLLVQQLLTSIAEENHIHDLPSYDEAQPENFPEYDDDIATEHTCPKCGYRWSGKASLSDPDDEGDPDDD